MDNEQLKRIADAMEEILRLVKQDQEASAARQRQWDAEKKWKELNTGISPIISCGRTQSCRGPMLPAVKDSSKKLSSVKE